ncbi:hypothetical protein MAR_026839 [Mya arenaria]|uniref:Uncharacterized protein n=1 Tax=Mya arenaria TaxID=6604 RepID=A0ABY7EU72_MYAAR|nr:hypothetical protein MAR_026839 [Mya arenaria]
MNPNCDNDPETDYPNVNLAQNNNAGHARDDPMQAFEHLRNIDGMRNNWTTDYYSYGPQPKCPQCGNSAYLYFNKSIDSIRFFKRKGRRPAPNPNVNALHRKACRGKFVLVGFKGNGRNRNNSDAENRQILSDAIAIYEPLKSFNGHFVFEKS